MRISLFREVPDDSDLRVQWNVLALQTARPQVFYTYEWARAVQTAYWQSLRPLVLLAHDEDQQLVGLAALATSLSGHVSFLCATTSDYCTFLVRPEYADEFTAQVFDTLLQNGHLDITLTNFPEDSPAFAALSRAASSSGFHFFDREAYLCAQVKLSSMELNQAGKLALPRQKMVRRSLRAMAEAGPVVVEHQTAWEEVQPALSTFFRAHVARFLYVGRFSNLIRPERRQFLSGLAILLSGAGWFCLTRMNAGPRTISWNYGFKFENSWFWYQPTFVNDLEKYSPGFVLLSGLVGDAAEDPAIDFVDLGLGAEGYKESFANATRRTMCVTLHRSRLRHWKEVARHGIATAITASPKSEKVVRSAITRTKTVVARFQHQGAAATLAWALSRSRRRIAHTEEVFFYEGRADCLPPSVEHSLCLIDYDLLAEVAIKHFDDEATLQYLLRAAARLRSSSAEGFALMDAEGEVLHLAWVTPFGGFFLDELQHRLDGPDPARVMLFDCWTPVSLRGRGYYAEAIQRVAQSQLAQGKSPWIFSAETNQASRSGIVKAGFHLRYSITSRRLLNWSRLEQSPDLDASAASEVAA